MQDRRAPFMELCWMKEDCIEMSWNVESIFYMAGFTSNPSLDVLLDYTDRGMLSSF
jgi:hypothetical protein